MRMELCCEALYRGASMPPRWMQHGSHQLRTCPGVPSPVRMLKLTVKGALLGGPIDLPRLQGAQASVCLAVPYRNTALLTRCVGHAVSRGCTLLCMHHAHDRAMPDMYGQPSVQRSSCFLPYFLIKNRPQWDG